MSTRARRATRSDFGRTSIATESCVRYNTQNDNDDQQDTEESGQQGTDGLGPGLGVGTALVGVSSVGYLLKRRLDDGE